MSKIQIYSELLNPLLSDSDRLEEFAVEHSNLPGPRANLELAFALAEIYDEYEIIVTWAGIDAEQAGVDNPRSFLPFCAAVCLGKIYSNNKNQETLQFLKKLSNDPRWRIREAAVFGFQRIGENDLMELQEIFSDWIKTSNNLEKRAILVSLAHPKLLDENNSIFCFDILDRILKELNQDNEYPVLKKGLDFVLSIYVGANQEYGFNFIENWLGKDKRVDSIIKSNLKKNRLAKKYPDKIRQLFDKLNV